MKLLFLLSTLGLVVVGQAKVFDRQVLSYAPIPEGTYVPPKKSGEVTLLDFIRSRDDLSELAKVVSEAPGLHSQSTPSDAMRCRDRHGE
jgi:hypothetical protein